MKFKLEIDWTRLRDVSQNAGIVILAGGMLHGALGDGVWREAITAIIAGGLLIVFSVIRRKDK